MTDYNTFYYKYGKDTPSDIPGVVDDFCSYGIDQVDICTVNVLSDNRTELKKVLKNQYFEKIRNVDDAVEFRGRISEVRFANEDRYNLTFKVKSPVERLANLASHVTAKWLGSEGTITALDATTITNSENISEPPGYVASSTGVMVVPGSDPASVEDEVDDITDYTAGGTQTGVVGDVNDDDPDTGVKVTKASVQALYQVLQGTSTNVKANVVAMGYDVTVMCKVNSIRDTVVALQYWDYIGTQWTNLGDTITVNKIVHIGVNDATYTFKGTILHNLMVNGSDKEFKIRLYATMGSNGDMRIKITMCEINFYTDAKYDGTFFPITAYTSAKVMTVTGNPATSGLDVGDTFVIGWKDSIILAEIFDEYSLNKFIPFTVNIGTLNNTYTARSFLHMDLMACLKYFMDKHEAHYWFDHENNILYIRTAQVMTSAGTLRTITEADIEKFGHDDKESSAVSNIVFFGGSYKRGDGEEIQVTYNYPFTHDGEWSGIGAFELIIDKPGIKNWTEARDYCKNVYCRLNSPDQMSASITLYEYCISHVISNKVTVTGDLDGLTITTEPIVGINTSYNVGNDLAIKTIQVGWQHTSLLDRLKNVFNNLGEKVADVAQVLLESYPQKSKLLRADGVIEGENIAFDQVTIINQGDGGDIYMTADDVGDVLDLGTASISNATLANGVVSVGNVSQHEAALAVKGSTLTDSVADARIESSSVTQHETDITELGNLASGILIGGQAISESGGRLLISAAIPGVIIKDTNSSGALATGFYQIRDENDAILLNISTDTGDLLIENALTDKNIELNTIGTGAILLNAGAFINDVDTSIATTPADTQLLTAQAIGEFTMMGSANAAAIGCTPLSSADGSGHAQFGVASGRVHNILTGTVNVAFYWVKPINMAGYKLIISSIKLVVVDADGNNYVNDVYLHSWDGVTYTNHAVGSGTLNRSSAGEYNYPGTWDMNTENMVVARVKGETDTQYALDVYVTLTGYYIPV